MTKLDAEKMTREELKAVCIAGCRRQGASSSWVAFARKSAMVDYAAGGPPPGAAAVAAPAATAPTANPAAIQALVEALGGGSAKVDALAARVDGLEGGIAETLQELRDELAPILSGNTAAIARGVRVATAMQAAGSNPIVGMLAETYRAPGADIDGTIACLCSPPSFGKSFSVRQWGQGYDEYFEHGCVGDPEEMGALVGSMAADGKGGFVCVDGVLVQAMRQAAAGRTVLFLFDELFRCHVRTAESLLTFFTGVATPAGRVWRLRTRKPTAAGEWEVVECPCANLHIVGAANLGALPPPDAFWSRLRIIRLEFSEAAARATAEAILAGHSIGGTVTDFARRYVAAMKTTRAAMVTGQLQYAADFRLLERACRYAATPDVGAVAVVVKNEMRNTCPGWNPDTGDIRSEGKAAVETAINLL